MEDEIDIDELIAIVTQSVIRQVDGRVVKVFDSIVSGLLSKEEAAFPLADGKFTIAVDRDGMIFKRNNDTALIIGKSGQIATGIRSPRTVGKGSMHLRQGKSTAVIPAAGKHTTRGLLVESDSDDLNTYSFRTVSRLNRQGFNIFGEGSVSINEMEKANSTLSVTNNQRGDSVLALKSISKNPANTLLTVDTGALASDKWDAITVTTSSGDSRLESKQFSVSGTGAVKAEKVYLNGTGYAEMFEWADGNSRNENRTGFLVSIDRSGKLEVADNPGRAVGVVVTDAALVSNTAWNHWHNKHKNNKREQVVEWLDDAVGKLVSMYRSDITDDTGVPETADVYTVDSDGEPITTPNDKYYMNVTYSPRAERAEWAMVCLLGSAPVVKGQELPGNWIRLRELDDETDLVLVK